MNFSGISSVEPSSVEVRGVVGNIDNHGSEFLGTVWATTSLNVSFDGAAVGYGTMSAEYQQAFQAAMNAWSAVTNLTFNVTDISQADIVVGWDPQSDGAGNVLGYATGYDTDRDGFLEKGLDGYLIAMDQADLDYFFSTAVHEIGHAIGLGHNDAIDSIMSTYLNVSITSPTTTDIANAADLYGNRDGTAMGWAGGDTNISGSNLLWGTSGADLVFAGDGQDTVTGGAGNDLIYGNKNVDLLSGGAGDDTIFGGQNDGTPSGSPLAMRDGVETIFGGDGADILYGNHGSEQVFGGSGFDVLYGGQDADTLVGGANTDILHGNLGSDVYVFGDDANGVDYIVGFEAGETIRLEESRTLEQAFVSGTDTVLQLGGAQSSQVVLIGITDASAINYDII